jgi:hypothetical protein
MADDKAAACSWLKALKEARIAAAYPAPNGGHIFGARSSRWNTRGRPRLRPPGGESCGPLVRWSPGLGGRRRVAAGGDDGEGADPDEEQRQGQVEQRVEGAAVRRLKWPANWAVYGL